MGEVDLEIQSIELTTEGGGVIHSVSEVYATERLMGSALVRNPATGDTGPMTVTWYRDGTDLMGMSHAGIGGSGDAWITWQDYTTIPEGAHDLVLRLEPEDPLFNPGTSTTAFTVIPHKHSKAMPEGQETAHEGWAATDVTLRVLDFSDEHLRYGEAVVQFVAPGGAESSGERGVIENGLVAYSQIWVPASGGSIRLWVTVADALNVKDLYGLGEAATIVDGSINMGWRQLHTSEMMSSSEARTEADRLGGKLSAGVDWKIYKAQAEISYEHPWQETDTETKTYEVKRAEKTLVVVP